MRADRLVALLALLQTRTQMTAAEVIKESTKTGKSIRDLVLERGWMTDAELDKALDVLALTKGGITK